MRIQSSTSSLTRAERNSFVMFSTTTAKLSEEKLKKTWFELPKQPRNLRIQPEVKIKRGKTNSTSIRIEWDYEQNDNFPCYFIIDYRSITDEEEEGRNSFGHRHQFNYWNSSGGRMLCWNRAIHRRHRQHRRRCEDRRNSSDNSQTTENYRSAI